MNENRKKLPMLIKILIFIILVSLILSILLNLYLLTEHKNLRIGNLELFNNSEEKNTINNVSEENNNLIQNSINNESNILNEVIENKIDEVTNTQKENNEIIVNLSEYNKSDKEPDISELKNLIQSYSVGINRISFEEENLESNTILLFIAKQFFDTHSSTSSSLKIDTKYAVTKKNVHKYLTELTGKDYTTIDTIPSYNNYIGYSNKSDSYILGSDSSIIKREVYSCSSLEVTDKTDGIYTAQATVTRKIEKIKTNYELTFTFKINEEYEYEKYNIISLQAENKSFYPDDTIHFVENPVEEE